MYGAIVGDIAGSRHEHAGTKYMDFPFPDERSFVTDDSVLTAATAEAILYSQGGEPDYGRAYMSWARRYPGAGFGGSFREWMHGGGPGRIPGPYGSYGNGSAMRVSPVGHLFNSESEVLDQAEASASVTHDHSEGIKGAQAAALAVFEARSPDSQSHAVADGIAKRFGYELSESTDVLRESYAFDVTCQGTMPAALLCVREATDFEHGIRLAVSLGGDADTLACIVGSICEPLFGGVPDPLRRFARSKMPGDMRRIVDAFEEVT
ncbi:MAG: ADP-ribosylglycohydrolase family protein [Spirochaetia bacterium]